MSTPGIPVIQINPVASANSLSFYWSSPLNIGTGLIRGYTLTCSSINFVQSFISTACFTQVSSLTNTEDHIFQIAAQNNYGLGAAATFLPAQPCTVNAGVGLVTASTVDATTAFISWSYSTNLNEATPKGFILTSFTSSLTTSTYSLYLNQSSLIIKTIGGNENYNFLVLPINDAGYALSTPQSISNTINFSSF